MRRTVLALVGAASLAVAALTSPAAQASPSPELASHAHVPTPRALGMVHPAHGGGGGPVRTTTSNLTYHNGPVMTTNTVIPVYLNVLGYSIPATYQKLINQYFSDVATASGSTSNVYASDTQYYQVLSGTKTTISYNTQVGTPVVDNNTTITSSGCKDRYTAVCLSDNQIQTELGALINNGKLPGPSINVEYFVFTPKGVGSCAGRSCAFSQYCAYHSWTSGGALYANMPYADTVPAACDAGQHPNASVDPDADATINVTSHEHNETITDPNGNAWYDSSGYENGDKCAWNFGAVTGPSGAEYNQTINNHNYFLQQEWSNAHNNGAGACVLQGT